MSTGTGGKGTNVLIISHDRIGALMAGQGVRFWELAQALATESCVKLAVPGGTTLDGNGFDLVAYGPDDLAPLEQEAREWAAVTVCASFSVHNMPFLQDLPGSLVADVTVPVSAESLAWNATKDPKRQQEAYKHSWAKLKITIVAKLSKQP